MFLDGVPEKVTIKAGEQVLAEKTKDQLKKRRERLYLH